MTSPTGPRHAAETTVVGGILGTAKAQATVDKLERALAPLADKISTLVSTIDKASKATRSGAQLASTAWNGGSNWGSQAKGRTIGGDKPQFSGRRTIANPQRMASSEEAWQSGLPTGQHREDGTITGGHRGQDSWVDMPNGGGATFSGGRGGMGRGSNGGGASFSGKTGGAAGLSAGFAGLRSYGKDHLQEFTGSDYLANYNRLGGGGSYNATLATVYGSHNQGINYASLGMQDATTAAFMSQAQTGLLASDPRYRPAFRQTTSLGLINPLAGSSGGAQWQTDVGSSQSFYAARMYGYGNTLNGGQQAGSSDPRQITRNIMARSGGANMSNRQAAAALGNNGALATNIRAFGAQAGWSDSTVSANIQYAQKLTGAQNKGWSASDFDRTFDIAAGRQRGSQKDALKRLQGLNIGIDQSMMERMRDRQSVGTARGADVLKDFAPAVIAASDALAGLSKVVTDLTNNVPGMRNLIGGGGGIASQLGGVGATAGGAWAGIKGVGWAARYLNKSGGKAVGKVLGGGKSLGGELAGAGVRVGGAVGGLGLLRMGGAVIGAGTVPDVKHPDWRYFQKDDKYYGEMKTSTGGWSSPISMGRNEWNKQTHNGTVNIGGGSLAGTGGTGGGGATVGGNNGHTGAQVVAAAESQIGKPYVWGATGPNSYDCSGLTSWAYARMGVKIPRTAAQQFGVGTAVDKSHLQAGDLMFYNYGRVKGGADHVGIYAGGGKMVDAPTAGKNVELTGIDWKHFIGAKRILGSAGTMTGTGDTGTQQQGQSGPGQNAAASAAGGYGSTEELEAVMAGLGGFGGSGAPSASAGSTTGAAGVTGGTTSSAPTSISANAALGKSKAAARGWTGAEWNSLYQLGMHESGWRNTAQNPSSTAYGIFQFLNSTWGSHKKTSDPGLQIDYGLDYIKSRYGDPNNAWSFWQKHHWYEEGAWEVGKDGGRTHEGEMVVPKDKAKTIRQALMEEGNPTRAHGGSGGLTIQIGNITVSVDGTMTEDSSREAARKVVDHIAEDARIRQIMVGV